MWVWPPGLWLGSTFLPRRPLTRVNFPPPPLTLFHSTRVPWQLAPCGLAESTMLLQLGYCINPVKKMEQVANYSQDSANYSLDRDESQTTHARAALPFKLALILLLTVPQECSHPPTLLHIVWLVLLTVREKRPTSDRQTSTPTCPWLKWLICPPCEITFCPPFKRC
jgi:hypothetical protein